MEFPSLAAPHPSAQGWSTSPSMQPPDLTLSPGIPPNDSPRTSEFEQGCFLHLRADVALTSDDPDPRKRQMRSAPPRDHPQSIRPAPHAKQQRSDTHLCSYLDNRGQLSQVCIGVYCDSPFATCDYCHYSSCGAGGQLRLDIASQRNECFIREDGYRFAAWPLFQTSS